MFKYLRFYITPFFIYAFIAGALLGGSWLWLGALICIFVVIPGDYFLGEDTAFPDYAHPWILDFMLYLSLPHLLLLLVVVAWSAGSGASDLFGIGAFVHDVTGYDALAARSTSTGFDFFGLALGGAFEVAGYGTNIGHELTHRTRDRFSMIWGRWLLAMSCNADFSVEHVWNHHPRVGTDADPATAKRGESVYPFILRSTVFGHLSAWSIEIRRLRRENRAVLSFSNAMLRGYLMSGTFIALFYLAAGWKGVALFLLQAMIAKALLEIVNYIEHYGLVREPSSPVKPHHSWNTNRIVSYLSLFSLTRHSAHHENGRLPFWKLDPYRDAPQMPFGYLNTIFIALIPPLWHRVIVPRLLDWDRNYANSAERAIAADQNRNSGIPALVDGRAA